MIGVALAGGAGALAVLFSLRASLALKKLALPDVAAVEATLRTGSDEQAAAAMRGVFADAAPAMIVAMRGASERDRDAGARALDERLGEIDGSLSEPSGIPRAAVRVALLSAALGAILELLRNLREVPVALSAVVLGVAAAGACFELGRQASRRVTTLRAEWDRLAAAAAARMGIAAGGTMSDGPVQRSVGRSPRRPRGRHGRAS